MNDNNDCPGTDYDDATVNRNATENYQTDFFIILRKSCTSYSDSMRQYQAEQNRACNEELSP